MATASATAYLCDGGRGWQGTSSVHAQGVRHGALSRLGSRSGDDDGERDGEDMMQGMIKEKRDGEGKRERRGNMKWNVNMKFEVQD